MIRSVRIKKFARLACFGFAPMVLGHLAAFVIAVPDHHARRELLYSTGHSGFHVIVVFALAVGCLAVSQFVRQGFKTVRRGGSSWGLPSVRSLVCLQAALYLVLEVTERAMSGGLSGLLSERPFFIGLALQILTALLAILKLRAISLVVARLARTRGPSRRRIVSPRPLSLLVEHERFYSMISRRGPPVILSL